MKIKSIRAREILDSRGNPTVEATMTLENGITATSSVPSGASTGTKEAIELRDQDKFRYNGKGVLKAVSNINTVIAPALIGMEINQLEIDKKLLKMDGTSNKANLGANATLAVSLCTIKCLAKLQNKELYEYMSGGKFNMPIPMMNILNGGVHADNNLKIQEFMIVPVLKEEKERIRVASEVYHSLKDLLRSKGFSANVGDEGGFAPNIDTTRDALDLIMQAINLANYTPGKDVLIALDCAASEFYDKNRKVYNIDNKWFNSDDLVKYYLELINDYPIISIEDPFREDDFESLSVLTRLTKNKIMIVGDDYFCTNNKLLEEGISKNAGNAILLKVNQIGTVSEMLKTISTAKKNNYKTIISHRSGETEDTFIADFAVGLGLHFIKSGAPCRGERISKYNRLMKIEEEIKNKKAN